MHFTVKNTRNLTETTYEVKLEEESKRKIRNWTICAAFVAACLTVVKVLDDIEDKNAETPDTQ